MAEDFANFKECFLVSLAAERVLNVTKYLEKKTQSLSNTFWNETPTVRGLAADNNNMQSVLMGNMETI